MAASADIAYYDLKPPATAVLHDVFAGLSAQPKTLPPKYFYDERGSSLFEEICTLPEYYPTRTELATLEAAAADVARRLGPRCEIVEYGSGSARKTAVLLRAVQPVSYVAVEISGAQLRAATARLAASFPEIRMAAVCADYSRPLELPRVDGVRAARRVVYFPGSTIGNFDRREALAFMRNARDLAGAGGAMLIGVDQKKDAAVLNAAYNDARGVTAAFNLNLLSRLNRELGADFDVAAYRHRAFYNEAESRIEMHLVSSRPQVVTIAGRTFTLTEGETIHTENSYKYSAAEFQALAADAGFRAEHHWTDPQRLFAIHYLTLPPLRP